MLKDLQPSNFSGRAPNDPREIRKRQLKEDRVQFSKAPITTAGVENEGWV